MWTGPYNAMGSYSFPTHYGDGTAVYEDDFNTDEWPDTDEGYRYIYGELDYHKMVPPSRSCMAAKLDPNYDIRTLSSKLVNRYLTKPVVCEGKNI